MGRFVYVDGRLFSSDEASVRVSDRGLLLADAVYTVAMVYRGVLIDLPTHLERLRMSLQAIDIPPPIDLDALQSWMRHLVALNRVRNGWVYVQISRGHTWPRHHTRVDIAGSLIISAEGVHDRHLDDCDRVLQEQAIDVVLLPDHRWARCDVKSTNLLPNVLSKRSAMSCGANDSIMLKGVNEKGIDHPESVVTEAPSSSVFIVDASGTLVTPLESPSILPSVTRLRLLNEARCSRISVAERCITRQDLMSAQEVFLAGAIKLIAPVGQINGTKVGHECPGPVSKKLYRLYRAFADRALKSVEQRAEILPLPSMDSVIQKPDFE